MENEQVWLRWQGTESVAQRYLVQSSGLHYHPTKLKVFPSLAQHHGFLVQQTSEHVSEKVCERVHTAFCTKQ